MEIRYRSLCYATILILADLSNASTLATGLRDHQQRSFARQLHFQLNFTFMRYLMFTCATS